MMLANVIDGLFKGTRYLVWGMGIVGIPLSIILVIANLANGIGAIAVMLSILLLSVAISLMLMPSSLLEKLPESIQEKRFLIGAITVVIAMALTGISYFSAGGFPSLNLLFIKI